MSSPTSASTSPPVRPSSTRGHCPTPSKVRYLSEESAQRFAIQMYQREYQCPCGAWHLTTSNVSTDYIEDLKRKVDRAQAAQKKASKKVSCQASTPAQPRVRLAIGDRVYLPELGYGRVRQYRDNSIRHVICDWDTAAHASYRVINVNTNAINRWPF